MKVDILGFGLILFSIVCGSVGQIVLKTGMESVPQITSPTGFLTAFRQPLVIGGVACYVLATLAWLVVLQRMQISFAYPMISMNYVFVTLLARYFRGEQVPSLRYLGLGLILSGVMVIARTGGADKH